MLYIVRHSYGGEFLMKNITMFDNVESLKKSIKDFILVTEYEFFNVLIKTGNSYHVVTIQYDVYNDSFFVSHPSFNFLIDEIEEYAILAKG